jgi:deoxyribodipyrimidine photo-lyase
MSFSAISTPSSSALVWLRRDLRLDDNAALYHALKKADQVCAVFVFDTDILNELSADDRRVTFIWQSIEQLQQALSKQGGRLFVLHGKASEKIPALAERLGVDWVCAAEDYEPKAIKRDELVNVTLAQKGIAFSLVKDQVIFAKDEVLSQKKTPLTVFTPYKNAWIKTLNPFYLSSYPVASYYHRLWQPNLNVEEVSSLEQIGFATQSLLVKAGETGATLAWQDFIARMDGYKDYRDFPAIKGVSYLSVHLRFGTLSIRKLASEAWHRGGEGAATWLSELIWREFYMQFLWHHPNVVTQAYKTEWRDQPWTNRLDWFEAWCDGHTGYPIVDAAMRQLNQTGFMHNRLRMIVAAFLIKDCDINWQWGEAYFAQKLLDFDLSANNGGWQWAASTGCDAAQPFRIFNPILQSRKFDPEGKFIRKYIPELATLSATEIHAPWEMPPIMRQTYGLVLGRDYPMPIVNHDIARKMALAKYEMIKNKLLTTSPDSCLISG